MATGVDATDDVIERPADHVVRLGGRGTPGAIANLFALSRQMNVRRSDGPIVLRRFQGIPPAAAALLEPGFSAW